MGNGVGGGVEIGGGLVLLQEWEREKMREGMVMFHSVERLRVAGRGGEWDCGVADSEGGRVLVVLQDVEEREWW